MADPRAFDAGLPRRPLSVVGFTAQLDLGCSRHLVEYGSAKCAADRSKHRSSRQKHTATSSKYRAPGLEGASRRCHLPTELQRCTMPSRYNSGQPPGSQRASQEVSLIRRRLPCSGSMGPPHTHRQYETRSSPHCMKAGAGPANDRASGADKCSSKPAST